MNNDKKRSEVEGTRRTFVQQAIAGEVTLGQIGEFIARWQEVASTGVAVHDFLGFSQGQWHRYLGNEAALPYIVQEIEVALLGKHALCGKCLQPGELSEAKCHEMPEMVRIVAGSVKAYICPECRTDLTPGKPHPPLCSNCQ